MNTPKSIVILSCLAFALSTVVVVLGAYTRLAEAGLGCPDWPTCYGHLWIPDTAEEIERANQNFADTPVENDKTWPEQAHRLVASTLGLLVFAIFFVAFSYQQARSKYSVLILLSSLIAGTVLRVFVGEGIEPFLWILVGIYFVNLVRVYRLKEHNSIPFKLPALIAGLIIVQGLFGMWTVTLKLWPQVVTAHLLGGFTTATLLFLLAQRLLDFRWALSMSSGTQDSLRRWALLALAVVAIQISLGGWTSANYAALACPDFPLCHDQVWPHADFRQGFNFFQDIGPNYLGGVLDNHARTAIHLAHRLGAIAVLLIVLTLCFKLYTQPCSETKRFAAIIASILFIQITLGIMNVVLSLPLTVAVIHNAVGAMLLISIVTCLQRIHSLPLGGRE